MKNVSVCFVAAVALLLLISDTIDGVVVQITGQESDLMKTNSNDIILSSQSVGDYGITATDSFSNSTAETDLSVENADKTCSASWFVPTIFSNGTTSCECGSDLGGVIECENGSEKVDLLRCYCMTFGVNDSMLVVGSCIYGCSTVRQQIPSNSSKLSDFFCGKYHREGQLCGKCEAGFAMPVYSYYLGYIKCERSQYSKNLLKYIAAAFFPLTLFFIIIVTFRIRVTSGIMTVFVLTSQIISTPMFCRMCSLIYHDRMHAIQDIAGVIISLYGMWNLDFFRLLYSPFCVHPDMTTIQILALDYLIAIYPLVLLAVAYLLVKLHDSNFKLIVCLWRPFHRGFIHFRRDWNIKTSLVGAFATFLLLSYLKFLSVSFDLLVPTHVYNANGKTLNKQYLYWDGTIEYFGKDHLPYAILAIIVLTFFNIIPMLLLCLYPSKWFQKCLNHCRWPNHALHTFMDAFQGCYKNGTNSNCDCRWFVGLYVFTEILFLAAHGVVGFDYWLPVFGFFLVILLLLTIIFQPYKSLTHNITNTSLLVVLLFIITYLAYEVSNSPEFRTTSNSLWGLAILIPLIYFVGVILYQLFGRQRHMQKLCQTVRKYVPCYCCLRADDEDFERTLPERMVNVEECAALLADPMHVSESDEELININV